MKRFILRVLQGAFLTAALLSAVNIYQHFKPRPVEPMTTERRAAHRVSYGRGYCSATAIGPHALLTATHCDPKGHVSTIHLDMVMGDYHIEKILTDGRDHDIYLIDGPALTNTVEYKVRPTKVGEHTHLYGSGQGCYPPRRLDGVRVDYDDPSDVDADHGVVKFTEPVIPGDSGSAVFNDDGTIGAVTTYLLDGESYLWGFASDPDTTLDFTPAFTPEQVQEAVAFQPTGYVAPDEPAQVQRVPTLFDLFHP